MKKILGVVGSPRRGANTQILVEAMLEGAAQAGAATELLFLADISLEECNGCHACWRGERCSKKDDLTPWLPRIAEFDGIIFGTPVYWFGPSGLVKTFLDRFVYFNGPKNRDRIRGHRVALAVPFEDTSPQTPELLIEMFVRSFSYLELTMVGGVLASGIHGKDDVIDRPEVLANARDLGRQLAADAKPVTQEAAEIAGLLHRVRLRREGKYRPPKGRKG
jgi:multimeric flavodoxin WrbA